MQELRRIAGGDPGVLVDAGIAVAAAGLTAVAAWAPDGLAGSKIAGPAWLLALLPLLMGAALALRRRAPLLMWTALWAGVLLQYLITRDPPRELAFLVALYAGGYSLGAHASVRRAAVGLGISAVMVAISEGALAAFSRYTGGVDLSLDLLAALACCLVGVFVRSRRQSVALAGRNAELQRQAAQVAAAERARIARELHDIVAHHLSVIVLQAAGARASGRPADAALIKIEDNGRQALTETRRLLGVLRGGGEAGLAPQPGMGELDALTATVRAAGLPVELVIDGDLAALPAAVDLSVYRIVQEALTNVLKHAGPACATVTIGCAEKAVTVEVTDDGTGGPGDRVPAGGHGLVGMRERATIFGGELSAGPLPGGGFAVRARLPLGEPS